jgi:phage tail sheath protein FI
MPVQPTYPGVYIEEIPSGVRTITGVATSITAFIGRAVKGKPDDPLLISSYSDYERMYGGLSLESTMSYAVRDYFLNGGSQAIIIRIHEGATPAVISIPTVGGSPPSSPPDMLTLMASSPGIWGNDISVILEQVPVASPPSSPLPPVVYNLKISYKKVQVEQHLNVSMDPNNPRYLPNVLKNRSEYVLASTITPNSTPTAGTYLVSSTGSDGGAPNANRYTNGANEQLGLNALYKTDIFNMLCIPPPERGKDTDPSVYSLASKICFDKRAILIVDPKYNWGDVAASPIAVTNVKNNYGNLGISDNARNAALYFPLLQQSDPNRDNQLDMFVPCGTVAGVIARTDSQRGIWKAPAGIDAGLNGVRGLQVNLTDLENGTLNVLGVNCMRSFPASGRVVWGARTLRGNDQLADEYKYLSVRRTALFIEESLYRGTQWVVFEPNDEPLWAQIRLNIGAFMHNLFRQGAFQGKTPKEAYLVKCDRETTTQNDINLGIVNILVGFAPLKPAEFVIIKIQQLAGQISN